LGAGPFASNYFGLLMVCGKTRCTPTGEGGNIFAGPITLNVRETSGPWLSAPSGLWHAKGWVRGTWTLALYGDSPSGLCGLVPTLGNQPLSGSSSTRNPSAWHQCAAAPVSDSVVTQGYAQGANTLRIGAWDAAGESVDYTRTIDVDNQQPSISLSGPAPAPPTPGTQNATGAA